MTEYSISEPTITITDQEIGLMKAFEKAFPSSTTSYLLCHWHISKNIQAKCKKWFPGSAFENYTNSYTN